MKPFPAASGSKDCPAELVGNYKALERSGLWIQFPHSLLPCPGFCVLESSTYNHLWEYCTDNRNPIGVGKEGEGEKEKWGRGESRSTGHFPTQKKGLSLFLSFLSVF